jgi:RNA polymerase sigma factor (sigma-70 family)
MPTSEDPTEKQDTTSNCVARRWPRALDAKWSEWLVHRPALMRLCLRWTRGNRANAEDLLSATCLKGMQVLQAGVTSPVDSASWWATIVANLARDLHRRRRCEGEVLDYYYYYDFPGSQPCGSGQSERRLVAREALARTFSRLMALGHRQRQAVLLRGVGNDYVEIARHLGTSTQNARKAVQLGRDALRSSRW